MIGIKTLFLATYIHVTVVASRLVPTKSLSTAAGVRDVVGLANYTVGFGFRPKTFYVPVSAPFVAEDSARGVNRRGYDTDPGTSVRPAWYSSIWSLSAGWAPAWNATAAGRLEITNLARTARRDEELFPVSGTYPNEVNPFTSDWKRAWWDRRRLCVPPRDQGPVRSQQYAEVLEVCGLE